MADVVAELAVREQWPVYVVEHVTKLLIARGASKVSEVWEELQLYCRAGATVLPPLRASLAELERAEPPPGSSAAINRSKQLHLTRGSLAATEELVGWSDRIAAVPARRLFAASDTNRHFADTMFIPAGFKLARVLDEFRKVVGKYQPRMREIIGTYGWPPVVPPGPTAMRQPKFKVAGDQRCGSCKNTYTNLWVNRGICAECEVKKRAEGTCPWNSRCRPESFCPHAARCFVCDAWSCAACGLHRGDGEDVAMLIDSLKPHAIFFDFDRTVATTKGGANPLLGAHTVVSSPFLFPPLFVASEMAALGGVGWRCRGGGWRCRGGGCTAVSAWDAMHAVRRCACLDPVLSPPPSSAAACLHAGSGSGVDQAREHPHCNPEQQQGGH